MKVGWGAIKLVGAKMVKDGAILEATEAGVKGTGLWVATLGVKPLAEKTLVAGKATEGSVAAAGAVADKITSAFGDTSIQIDAAIDFPLVGHRHKDMSVTTGLGTALSNPALNPVQQQKQVVQEQQHLITKRAAKIDVDAVKSALHLAEDCIARAICDVHCDPHGFGQDGKQVSMNMVRLQGANVLGQEESKCFHDAAAKGRTFSGKCSKCTETYKERNSKSSNLIRMPSHIRMDYRPQHGW